MASTINAITSGGGGIAVGGDTSGVIALQKDGTTFATGNQYGIGLGTAVPSSGIGIAFPATQSASSDANTLDDYEEGSWTPTFTPLSGSFSSVTYSAQGGFYTKIGNMCYAQGRIRTSAISVGTASSDIYISGLPFTSVADSVNGRNAGSVFSVTGWNTNNICAINVESGQSYMQINYRTSANGAMSQSQVSDLTTGGVGNQIFFSIAYRVA